MIAGVRPLEIIMQTLGLILDIAGVALLWRYGLPPDIHREGRMVYASPNVNIGEVNKAKLYDLLSNLAMFLLITGFFLQIVSSQLQSAAMHPPVKP